MRYHILVGLLSFLLLTPLLPEAREGRQSSTSCPQATSAAGGADYVEWLESRSMLKVADGLGLPISGTSTQWQNPYARPRPRDLVHAASVWFTSYPQATITDPSETVLESLGSEELLATFQEIGIEGIHTGPMKRAGGIVGCSYTPSVDGFFDRIELAVDPLFGTNDQYREMTKTAGQFGITVIGDLVPGHTGKGADFRLAERGHKSYPGIYTMVEIARGDWDLLGDVPNGADSVNLSLEVVQHLEDKGYIPGPLEIVIFHEPGVKDTNWDATGIVTGVDGRQRRWVYLHVFKAGQPSLNWLDPAFGAQRIVAADAAQSLVALGASGLRLDANSLLGIEGRPGKPKAWIEGHPLAVQSSNTIAMMVRKLGGYSFQELNLSLDEIKSFTQWGADLSYDFITRPPYLYAMATGDAGPLRLMLQLMQEEGLDPGTFVHALQNHDELMFDLAHLRKHGEEKFLVSGKEVLGQQIYHSMYERAKERVMSGPAAYNQEFSNLGFCGTLAGFAAASLGIKDPYGMNSLQKSQVRKLHLSAATLNAMQPGVFALSGWDLVGALPVQPERLGSLLEDRDCRWINRGAFDLMGADSSASASRSGLPKAEAIYGPLPEQLRDPGSFATALKRMLKTRKEYQIASSKLIRVPTVSAPGLVVMLFEAHDEQGWIITAVNFGRELVHETISLPEIASKSAQEIFSTDAGKQDKVNISDSGSFPLRLGVMQAKVYAVGR